VSYGANANTPQFVGPPRAANGAALRHLLGEL
jgi:hypothetical protein